MIKRPTQASIFLQVRTGLAMNQSKLVRAQEQASTGKRILRPSDDALGSSVSMSIRRQKGSVDAYRSAMTTARPVVSIASSQLEEASGVLTEARAVIMQGLNGTLGPQDRTALANQLDLIYENLLDIGNSRLGDRYLFAGTATATPPFAEDAGGRVVYRGDSGEQSILIGRGVELGLNVAGDEIFGRFEYSSVRFDGLTGVAAGTSANSGTGYHDLRVRHDATLGAPTAGIVLASGGANDTIIGDHAVDVDGTAGTARLGGGKLVHIPAPPPSDLQLMDADGSLVVLDLSAWSGADASFVLTGAGSIAVNDTPFQAISLTETDLELVDAGRGVVLHVDTTRITRAATELVTFGGTPNIFDTLRGAAADLRNEAGLDVNEALERVKHRLGEFDRNHSNLLVATAALGSRTERLDTTEARLDEVSLHFETLISNVEDADLTQVILELTQAEQTLQAASATGVRLIGQTLLDFLR